MNTTQKICHLLDCNSVKYKLFSHPETRTSEESYKARQQAAGESVIGAKALLMKMTSKKGATLFNVFVLPGDKRLDSKALKSQLKDVKSFRFATSEEMAELTGGLVPGSMPPFVQPIFENLNHLFIDTSLLEHERIGFNAASLTQSLIVSCNDYIRAANPTDIFPFAC
ncbi:MULTISPECIES: YbaK/EbsC family protein [Aerosakkonema]|uniref:YbaK/EbsC family protein n=1 Tax=Aerosakkonema TaxID=1246629 RepID=UPI0035BB7136